MTMQIQTLTRRLAALELPVSELIPLSGGDSGAELWRAKGTCELVVKRDEPARIAGEADGLRTLAAASRCLIVPEVLAEDADLLVMTALERGGDRDPEALGEGLRQLHVDSRGSEKGHGWPRDNACGLTPQPNAPLDDGRRFQRERRLLPLLTLCRQSGLLDASLAAKVAQVAETLESWLPDAPACLVHGDLWSGNVIFTSRGPAMIDPAVYRHYAEVDVAMLTLFGDPGAAFHEAYWDGDCPDDWARREALFQLYPLLNHLYLFGTGYRRGVERAVSRVLDA